tara:strand:+ start:2222 stop:3118 length:897 start_codon:yes stop_codon:yes gene_type:complete
MKNSNQLKRMVLDGNNLVHRAFWVSKNQPSFNEHFHVYLFLNSVRTYVKLYEPDVVYCAWDEKANYQLNKRKELLEDYKGNRDKEKNKDVHTHNYIIKELLEYLNIRNVCPYAYEADDVMAIFADQYKEDEKVIITVDKDLCQLIDSKTVVYDPIRKIEFNDKNFEETLKCKKEEFVIIKALAGDKSDNIPGLKGFGKVKIQKYLNGEIAFSVEEANQYAKNLKLMDLDHTLQNEIEVSYVVEQLNSCQQGDFGKFKTRCKELGFHQILKKTSDWFNTFFFEALLKKSCFTNLSTLLQ